MIEFKNVSKIYKTKKGVETKALNNINLKIGNKGMVFIVGKSGSGKSTMLNLLGGLDNITSGKLFINNKDISKFKNKQYDAYRNTYIGFIFQEFNILEEYNVLENIELALRLQNKKSSKEEIDNLLKKLGLENLDQRKINELSGGQKQRVAIARALIKNPEIILADEPTGNLDQTSSKQIFDLLKEISKEKLVIVVSHDMESAKNYADRIIEISDGNITNDTNPETEPKEEKFNLKKAKLPFSYSFKMALRGLTHKPFKLVITCILTAMSLIFMGFTIGCLIFDKETFITNTMKDNNKFVYIIDKTEYYGRSDSKILPLNNQDISNIKKATNLTLNQAYSLYDNEQMLEFTYGNKYENTPQSFSISPVIRDYVEIEDNKLLGKIIGSLPTTDRELVIHKYLAEYIIKFGVMDNENKIYKPNSIEELINSNRQIKLGDNFITISGVVDDDNSLFKEYKNKKEFKNDNLYAHYEQTYASLSSTAYVKGFTKTAKLNNNKELILNKMFLTKVMNTYGMSSKEMSTGNLKNIKKPVQVLTSNGMQTFDNLNKDEVIVSVNDLQTLDYNYNEGLQNYLIQSNNISQLEAIQTYTENYIKNDERFQNVRLKLRVFNSETNNYDDTPVTIKGITLEDNSYVSNKYVEEYTPREKVQNYIYIYDNDVNHQKEVFNNLKYRYVRDFPNGTYYSYEMFGLNNSDLSNIIGTYKDLYIYLLVVSLVFVLFTILLFSNFIGVSISYAKKEIGILRALGARGKDTLKIFTYESLIIGFISWILSVIGWLYTCNILNQNMFGSMYYKVNGMLITPLVPLGMLVFTIVIALVVTFTIMNSVNKVKPIDAILNK